MKYIKTKTDYGYDETYEKWNGKFLDENSYDEVITITEDTAIMKPINSVDGSDVPLAYVITNAYPDDGVRNTLMSITETTTMRANCSGPIDSKEMEDKGLVEGINYQLRNENSYKTKMKNGEWGMIAYANEIHSVMIGFKRGRFTGAIESSGWTKDNPDRWESLQEISKYNEEAFKKANLSIYTNQKTFVDSFIDPKHRVGGGIFTTLSANRYNAGQSTKMSAHIDSGDVNAGLTTMCCFRKGEYTGAYLAFPQYRVAIDAPDNSVVIADSNRLHGVTEIHGEGERFSCVAYCDGRLATKGNVAKQVKAVGRFAKDTTPNLEGFWE
jgi:hypothetical protein